MGKAIHGQGCHALVGFFALVAVGTHGLHNSNSVLTTHPFNENEEHEHHGRRQADEMKMSVDANGRVKDQQVDLNGLALEEVDEMKISVDASGRVKDLESDVAVTRRRTVTRRRRGADVVPTSTSPTSTPSPTTGATTNTTTITTSSSTATSWDDDYNDDNDGLSFPSNCKKRNAKGLCEECVDETFYLSRAGDCLRDCPPGDYQDAAERKCKFCHGQTNRRRATTCTHCPDGHVGQEAMDDCVNMQSLCSPKQCAACESCLARTEGPLIDCWHQKARGKGCIDFDKHWCGRFMTKFVSCEGYSMPCFYKILCQSPCVCDTWKAVRCGGQVNPSSQQCTGSFLQNLMQANIGTNASSMLNRAQRGALLNARGTDSIDVDFTAASKCTA
jgi:hypothetical protein